MTTALDRVISGYPFGLQVLIRSNLPNNTVIPQKNEHGTIVAFEMNEHTWARLKAQCIVSEEDRHGKV